MKTRQGFVSNSSSSSFIIASPKGQSLKTKITMEIDLNDYAEHHASSVIELNKYFNNECGAVPINEDDYGWKDYNAALEAINKGQTVYFGSFSSESEDGIERMLCDTGLEGKVGLEIVIIQSEGGY